MTSKDPKLCNGDTMRRCKTWCRPATPQLTYRAQWSNIKETFRQQRAIQGHQAI